jgi:uncharacterized protein YjbI with pentapeptide repeats
MNTDREHSEQQTKQSRWGFRGMTVRDWLQLLIVPLALVVIGFLFTAQQDQRQQQIEDQRAQQAQKIENQRAEAERELAVQRAQDEALQAYLNQMSNLLLEKDLRNSEEDSEVRTLARARTLTVLGRLDWERNVAVLQFLREAKLVGEKDPVVRLDSSDWIGANLQRLNLANVDLSHSYLSDANLSGADLSRADLHYAYLARADLSHAYLHYADLSNAFLVNADLRPAKLRDADLSGANLSNADLTDAHVSERQLLTAKSLNGATMPNGKKYEDWLNE